MEIPASNNELINKLNQYAEIESNGFLRFRDPNRWGAMKSKKLQEVLDVISSQPELVGVKDEEFGLLPISLAADFEVATKMIDTGNAKLNDIAPSGQTELIRRASYLADPFYNELAKYMVDSGQDVAMEAVDPKTGETALQYALRINPMLGNGELIEKMIDSGKSNPNNVAKDGTTALDVAKRQYSSCQFGFCKRIIEKLERLKNAPAASSAVVPPVQQQVPLRRSARLNKKGGSRRKTRTSRGKGRRSRNNGRRGSYRRSRM